MAKRTTTKKEKETKRNGSVDTMIMVGIALLVVAGVLIYMSVSSPRVYVDTTTAAITTAASPTTIQQVTSASPPTNKQTTGTTAVVRYPVNINTATMEELQAVKGIGEGRAYQIIAYRDRLGGYTSVEQIKDIKGIGDSLYSKIAPYLTV